MSLSVRTRFEVFKRDRFTCGYCGKTPPNVTLEVDHIIPVAAGGSDDEMNLITSCWECNRGKSDRLLEEGTRPVDGAQVADLQERIAQTTAYMELLTAKDGLTDRQLDRLNERWANAFGASTIEEPDGRVHWRLEGGRFPQEASLRRLLRRLPLDEMLEAIDITASRFGQAHDDTERYFFGVCWSKVREREAK